MKFLTDREEIAQAINGRKMPVVTIDLADADEYGLISEPVVVDEGTYRDGFTRMTRGHIRCFRDAQQFTFHAEICGISANFGYGDVEEMAQYRNAPVLTKDTDVILVIKDSKARNCWVAVLHTGKSGNYFIDNDTAFNSLLLKRV